MTMMMYTTLGYLMDTNEESTYVNHYGRDPYLDGLKIRLANKILESSLPKGLILENKEIKQLSDDIKEYIKQR